MINQADRAEHLEQRRLDLKFLLAVIVLVIAQFVTLFSQPTRPFTYLWYSLCVAVLLVGYARGRVYGLLSSLVAVFGFGSFNMYQFFIAHDTTQISGVDALWFFLFPLCGFTGGYLGDYVRTLLHRYETVYGSVDELLLADPLTGLTTRKRFFFDLQEELERAKRHFIRRERAGEGSGTWETLTLEQAHINEVVTVLLFEIAHFNEFVTIYGEAQSNKLLTTITETMHDVSRESDRKAKIDRARFALILPETPQKSAAIVRDRLNDCLESFQMEARSSRMRQVSLQMRFGMATAPQQGHTAEDVFGAAERELGFDLG
ncbi:diguanylate cyclase domain-containing protein [Tumebacillus permanentifrigoris]|uniref:Diguanylate cyclase (GGDEF)-like protein n=1 Tax=Tumebacillus permanentifrigoris TaxID=378543 RepID=A0A316DET9_9BACL|nr:diguanylate cyclase [Tumebacillus permanentifrigoris]PWK16554.1 diguanylate cyclase (GGDEF)-like protein [Tumebacillus permanentifrigoris]